ncbi:MAG TPA: DUF72 domain-containing protein [Puia sp.]|nr:DUF72 domain-containing protein [Puia sp.]
MEFGKTARTETVDFTLPPDDPITDEMLAGLNPSAAGPVRIHVGCAIWGRKDWVGKVYPQGAKERDFLSYYVRQFNTIELNTLFYSLQPKEVIGRWASLAGSDFRFCPKFSNTISHLRQLRNVEKETELFIDHMHCFGASLGPSFLQLSDRFAPSEASLLQEYARRLPRDFRACIELRQEDWFPQRPHRPSAASRVSSSGMASHIPPFDTMDPSAVRDTWRTFLELGIGTVITDTSGRRDVLHMKLTAPVAFIRFVGNSGLPTDYTRVDAWVGRIGTWIDKGLRDIYFFVHNHEERNSPELCKYAIEKFNERCGLDLAPPQLEEESQQGPADQLSLF